MSDRVQRGEADEFIAKVKQLTGAIQLPLAKGQVLDTASLRAPACIVVERGGLAVSPDFDGASGPIIEVLGPGDCLRYLPDHDDFWLTSLMSTRMFVAPYDAVKLAIQSDHRFAAAAFEHKVEQYMTALRYGLAFQHGNSMRRVASALLYLVERIGISCPIASGTRLEISQDVLAAVAMVTRQTANRELQRLRQGRYIHLSRSTVCLVDRSGLSEVRKGGPLNPPVTRLMRCKNAPAPCRA